MRFRAERRGQCQVDTAEELAAEDREKKSKIFDKFLRGLTYMVSPYIHLFRKKGLPALLRMHKIEFCLYDLVGVKVAPSAPASDSAFSRLKLSRVFSPKGQGL